MFESLTDLRTVLLLLGVVLLLLLYLWGKRRSRKEEWELPADADMSGEPVLPEETKPEDEWEIIPLHASRQQDVDEGALEQMRGIASQTELLDDDIPTLTDVVGTPKPVKRTPPKPLPEIVMVMTILAKPGKKLSGTALLAAAGKVGLRFGDKRIFHRTVNGNRLFHMANILEPGYFELNSMENFSTPGVALFTRLPGRSSGTLIMEEMINTARNLAKLLDAEICDDHRKPITEEGFARLQDKARPYAPVSRD